MPAGMKWWGSAKVPRRMHCSRGHHRRSTHCRCCCPDAARNARIDLYDLTGRVMASARVNGVQHAFDVSALAEGNYVLVCASANARTAAQHHHPSLTREVQRVALVVAPHEAEHRYVATALLLRQGLELGTQDIITLDRPVDATIVHR